MTCLLAILLSVLPSLAIAQNPAPVAPAPQHAPNPSTNPEKPKADPAKPQIEKLGEFKYRLGTVIIQQKTREIRFPAKVNINQGLFEYLICGQQGKVHEALLITEISPTHLSLAFTLLRFPPSNELFSTLDETGHQTGLYPNVSATVKAGARIAIEVEWNADGSTHRLPVNEWIQHSVKTTAMKAGPWLYTGSDFYEGKFIPEMTGDIAAIMTMPSAMINYPGSDNDDNVWFGFPKRIPPVGTPVTVIITPFSNSRPLPKP
jgi:hypothetical protein